ncbi:hypothetical protein BH11ARM2_BH11ARM2_18460 [soil metagenome]
MGGNESTATFRMLRAAESDQFYNVSATGIDLGQSFVSIPAGTRDASIAIVPRPVSTATDVTITVTDSYGTVSTKVHVVPPHLVGASLSPTSMQGGQTASLMLTLDGPAPAGGRTITLVSTKPSLMVPASVTIPEGGNAITISIPSTAVTKVPAITLTARLDAARLKMPITLTP